MPSPITIGFAVRGYADVQRALGGVESAMVRLERAGGQAAVKGASERVKTTKGEVDSREKEYGKLVKDVEKLESDATKAVERETKRRERSYELTAKAAIRWDAEVTNEVSRQAKRQTSLIEREAENQARAIASAHRKTAGSMGSAVMNGTGRAFGALGGLAGIATTIGGGFTIADAMRGQFAAQNAAAQLVNAVTTGSKAPEGATVAAIMKRASGVAIDANMSKEDVIGGALAYSRKAKGGDFEGAMGNMGFFAQLAKVTGTDISEIAGAAGTLQSQNADLKAPQMQQMLLDVYAQGKAGSLSMGDVAKQLGKMSSTRSSYQGDAATNQRKLLALGQLAAPEGSPEEAATYIADLTMEAGKHSKQLAAMGVKYDKTGRMESPEQMISAVLKSTGGDMNKIEEKYGVRGRAIFAALQPSFLAAGGGDAGVKAAQEQMGKVTRATMTSQDLDAQMKTIMDTPAQRIGQASEKIREALETAIAPGLEKLADKLPELEPQIERVIGVFAQLAGDLADHPVAGISALILGSITTDLAGAAIGEAVKKALLAQIGGGGGGGSPPGSPGGIRMPGMGPGGSGIGFGEGVGRMLPGVAVAAQIVDEGKGVMNETVGKAHAAAIAELDADSPKMTAQKILQYQKDLEWNGTGPGHASKNAKEVQELNYIRESEKRTGAAELKDRDEAINAKATERNNDLLVTNNAHLVALTAALKTGKDGKTGGSTGGADRHTDMGNRGPAGGASM